MRWTRTDLNTSQKSYTLNSELRRHRTLICKYVNFYFPEFSNIGPSNNLRDFKCCVQPYTLIFVPSYFDFVRVRNFLNKEDVDVAPISEYSPDDDVSRARTMFYQGRLATIVTTERFYFYRRLRIRGIRHIIFYSVPTLSHFYSEFLNLVEEATSQSIPTSSITLYSRYEKVPLERVVGTDRVTKMVDPSSKSTFLFT